MKFTDSCSILAGACRDNALLIAVMNDGLAEERQQHAIPLLYRHGAWMLTKEEKVLPWIVAGIASLQRGPMQFVIVGWAGQVLVVKEQNSYKEAIRRKGDYVSIVRAVATINGAVYTAGMRRQVYKRRGSGHWEAIDLGVAYHNSLTAVGFDAIDGFSDNEIYAVGLNGEMWLYDGDFWKLIHSLTNVHLHAICCAPNGEAYIGGRAGFLICGRGNCWDTITLETDETIWDLEWFEDKLYVLSNTALYHVVSGRAQRIEAGPIRNESFHTISSMSGKLWAFGRKKIAQYDGASWNEIDCVLPEDLGDAEVSVFFGDEVHYKGSSYLEGSD